MSARDKGHGGAARLLVSEMISNVSAVINCRKFSTLVNLHSVTALVLKFIRCLKGKVTPLTIRSESLAKAERLWLVECQSLLITETKYELWEQQLGLLVDNARLI